MDAEQVIEKILAEAKAEAEKINNQAAREQQAEQAELDELLAEHHKQTQILARKAAEDTKAHLLATARMTIAKEYLAEKRRVLDEVFEKAREKVKNLPAKDYRGLMKKLMLKAVETGDEEVVLDAKETRIDEDFITEINHQLGSNKKGNLRLSPQREDLGAGFILKRGKIKTNASLDVLLSQAREELEMELAKDLFGTDR